MVMLGYADEGRYRCIGDPSAFEWHEEKTIR